MQQEEQPKHNQAEKCPRCGRALETGYLMAPRGLRWDTKRHRFSVLGAETIITMWRWLIPDHPAERCDKCKLYILRDGADSNKTPPGFVKKCVQCGAEIPIAAEDCYSCGIHQE